MLGLAGPHRFGPGPALFSRGLELLVEGAVRVAVALLVL